jgi:hypothetical protein
MKNFVHYTSRKCLASACVASPRLNRLGYAISFSGLVIQITISCLRPEFGKLQISKSSRNTCIAGLVRLKVGVLSCHRFRLAFVINCQYSIYAKEISASCSRMQMKHGSKYSFLIFKHLVTI